MLRLYTLVLCCILSACSTELVAKDLTSDSPESCKRVVRTPTYTVFIDYRQSYVVINKDVSYTKYGWRSWKGSDVEVIYPHYVPAKVSSGCLDQVKFYDFSSKRWL